MATCHGPHAVGGDSALAAREEQRPDNGLPSQRQETRLETRLDRDAQPANRHRVRNFHIRTAGSLLDLVRMNLYSATQKSPKKLLKGMQ